VRAGELVWVSIALVSLSLGACRREVQVLSDPDVPRVDAGAADDSGVRTGSGRSDLASGGGHNCRLDVGILLCWGANRFGQLGIGSTASVDVPTPVGEVTDWVEVSVGDQHSCARRADGTISCWGSNESGQLGLGDRDDRLRPTRVPGGPWTALSAGAMHTCAIDAAGALFCWGRNFEGQIGQDDLFGAPDVLSPAVVAAGTAFASVSGGDGHTCAITAEGSLYCWGRNDRSQCGLGPGVEIQYRAPQPVGDALWEQVAGTQHHTCGIRQDGVLHCWGLDTHGELGFGVPEDTVVDVPTPVGSRDDWRQVDVHWFSTCAVGGDEAVWCAGRGIEGQLGQGEDDLAPSSRLVQVLSGERWARVSVGRFHVCAMAGETGAHCWGDNEAGQLGVGDRTRRYLPTPTR